MVGARSFLVKTFPIGINMPPSAGIFILQLNHETMKWNTTQCDKVIFNLIPRKSPIGENYNYYDYYDYDCYYDHDNNNNDDDDDDKLYFA